MARSEMRGKDPGSAMDPDIPRDAETERPGARAKEGNRRRARRLASNRVSTAERDRMLKDARDIQFPTALRGYERSAVDRYVEKVNRLIAELEISSSPESAVRHALDEVSEETRDLLQRAHQTANEITARSRSKADDRLQQAEREVQDLREAAQREAEATREAAQREAQKLEETTQHKAAELREAAGRETQQVRAAAQRQADEMRVAARREADQMLEAAETRAQEFARNAENIWRERRRLIEDVRAVGEQLVAIGEAEAKRFPHLAEDSALVAEAPREETSTTINEPAPVPQKAAQT